MFKLSIITINRNNSDGLKRTIESVVCQTFRDFEYIVIDGASTDGSVEVIKQYEDKITYWVSEPDSGIYNAMNKGIEKARGEYCLFLNSGDSLIGNTILEKVFNLNVSEDILYGDLMVIESKKKWEKTYPDKLTFEYFLKDTLSHPSSFIKKKLFETAGKYNETNKIVSDWEFFILVVNKYNCTYKHLPFVISEFIYDGISSLPDNSNIILQEKNNVLKKYFPCFTENYAELMALRQQLRELNKIKQELCDLKKSVFFKYGFKIGQAIKHLFKQCQNQ